MRTTVTSTEARRPDPIGTFGAIGSWQRRSPRKVLAIPQDWNLPWRIRLRQLAEQQGSGSNAAAAVWKCRGRAAAFNDKGRSGGHWQASTRAR